jgi:GAF domain-containing protein
MDSSSALTGLARLSGLLVSEHDPLSVITAGLSEARDSVGAQAGGVLVRSSDDQLEVLAATSHRAADLEAYQTGSEHGPCVESMREGRAVIGESPAEAEDRWPGFGRHMEAAGYVRAHAVPMLWQGVGVGGLNLFWSSGAPLGELEEHVLQTYADMLTIAVVHVRPVPVGDALLRLRGALESRTGIEQAKGVLSFQRDIGMEAAYEVLVDLARRRGLSMGEAVTAVIESARRGEAL